MARRYRVIATFNDAPKAEAALGDLSRHGYPADRVAVLLADRGRGRHFAVHARHKLSQGAALGGLLGGSVGALALGVAAALGWELPGLAAIGGGAAAASTLAAFVGAGAGGLLGWVIGAVVGLGYDEHEAVLREGEQDEEGHILVGVEAESEDQADAAEQVFARGGATSVAS